MAAPPQAQMLAAPAAAQPRPSTGGAAQATSGAGAENCQAEAIGQAYNMCCCPCTALAAEAANIVTVKQGSCGVVSKFGQFDRIIPPGRHRLNMMSDTVIHVSLKVSCVDVPPQDVITSDNLALQIDAVVYFVVVDPYKAVFAVDRYRFAVANLAQVILRQTLGENTLAEIMKDRSKINARLKELIDVATDPWGISVSSVELKGVSLDQMMQRAMASKAESKQQAEAKIIQAKAQRDVSEILAQASRRMNECPESLQLQYLETLRIVSTQQAQVNRIVIMPADLDPSKAIAMASA